MPRSHSGLPRPAKITLHKSDLLTRLAIIDKQPAAQARILKMETAFRARITSFFSALPAATGDLEDFNTSPFVLLFYAQHKGYSHVKEIESDIIPAKIFSSAETSAGRMIEDVVRPFYGWQPVASGMHTPDSSIDAKKIVGKTAKIVTLKSGPRCLNDEMSANFADDILNYHGAWLSDARLNDLDYTYGVLYGTPKQSNKKDWHILRQIKLKAPKTYQCTDPANVWKLSFKHDGITAEVSVRIGTAWWEYFGGPDCLLEIVCAMIRACVVPKADIPAASYVISDLMKIVSTATVPKGYNISLLQQSQIPWVFFIMRHFCDELI